MNLWISKLVAVIGFVILVVGLAIVSCTRTESYTKDPYGTGLFHYRDTYYRFRDFNNFYRVVTRKTNGEVTYQARGQMRDRNDPKRHGRWIIWQADDRFEEGFYEYEAWYWYGEHDPVRRASRE